MKEYRGWLIVSELVTQLNYRVRESTHAYKAGRGRKIKGYMLSNPDDGTTKFVDTLAAAKHYIDEYMG